MVPADPRGSKRVEPGDDPVPIAEEVESDHRHDDDQREHVDNRHAAGKQIPDESAQPTHRIPRITGGGLTQPLELGLRQLRLDMCDQRLSHRLQAVHVLGYPGDEIRDLVLKHGRQHHQHGDDREEKRPEDDRRREASRAFQRLQSIGQRIQEIRDRHPGEEGKKGAAKQIDQDASTQQHQEP